MTRAAEFLHVSQPSISKVLAHAEQQLGYRLFERRKGKLVPTPEAHRLFGHVTTVYRDIDQLRHVAENLRAADSGMIRIATTPAFAVDLVPKAVASYQKQHADTIFEIETLHHDEIIDALLESRLDIGLAFEPQPPPGIAEELLGTGRFVVLTPVDFEFAGKTQLSVKDLQRLPFISLSKRGPLGRILSTHLETSNVSLDVVAHSETYQVAKALVANGAGVTITDQITAQSDGHNNIRIWTMKPELRFRISLLHFDAAPISLVARRFVDHLSTFILESVGVQDGAA